MLLYQKFFLILFLLQSPFLYSSQQLPATINLNLNITQDQKQSSNATNTNDVASSVKNKIEAPKDDTGLIDLIKQLYQAGCEKSNAHASGFFSFFEKHPFKIAFGLLGGCYLYILYRIESCKKTIYSPDSWCCWNESMETTELTMIPYSKIHEQLIEDIQKKYLINQDTIAFIDSLEQFVRDIKTEIKILTFYIKLHKNITRCHADPAFFLKETTLLAAEDRLQRVRYLYGTFATWHTKQGMHKHRTE
jgi:hypothetical protein